MDNGLRRMELSDIDTTRSVVSKNTEDSRSSAEQSLNNFVRMLQNFKSSEAQNTETDALIREYGGMTFDTIFEKTGATGEELEKEYKLKLSLITNYIKNSEKHMRV